jgi:hypothetical protein
MMLLSGDCLELVGALPSPTATPQEVKVELQTKLLRELDVIARKALPNPSTSEAELLRGLRSAAEDVFTRSILR